VVAESDVEARGMRSHRSLNDDTVSVIECTESVTIKPTSPRDFPTLRALFDDPSFAGWGGTPGPISDAEITAKYVGKRLPEVECFIVIQDAVAVGLALLHATTERSGGIDLILLSGSRGRGVGRSAVSSLAERARKVHGWRSVTVDPDLTNPDGIRFWQAVGFEPLRRVPGSRERTPYLLMERRLDRPGHRDRPRPIM
jgi:GNAT superfamily N-acetyltransferase